MRVVRRSQPTWKHAVEISGQAELHGVEKTAVASVTCHLGVLGKSYENLAWSMSADGGAFYGYGRHGSATCHCRGRQQHQSEAQGQANEGADSAGRLDMYGPRLRPSGTHRRRQEGGREGDLRAAIHDVPIPGRRLANIRDSLQLAACRLRPTLGNGAPRPRRRRA